MKRILFAVLLAAAPAFADRYDRHDRHDDGQAGNQDDYDWSGGYDDDEQYDWAESDGTEGNWQTVDDSASAQQAGPALDDFRYDKEMSWYGDWIDTPEYGRVWRPTRVGDEWQPYLYGRWVWTRAGWAWASDEPFGWAVYHYGRWAWAPGAGWMWVPGRVWAPAWVAWRWTDGYAAWCPLGPRSVIVQRPALWVVVPTRHFLEPVRHHVVPRPQRQALPLPPRPGPRAGPAVAAVERAIGRTVRPLPIGQAGTPSSARVGVGSVDFYRPRPGPVATQPRAVAPPQTQTLRPVPQGPRAVAPGQTQTPRPVPQNPRAGRLGGFSQPPAPAQPQPRPNVTTGPAQRGPQAQPPGQGPKAVVATPPPGKAPTPHASAPIPRSNPEQPQAKER